MKDSNTQNSSEHPKYFEFTRFQRKKQIEHLLDRNLMSVCDWKIAYCFGCPRLMQFETLRAETYDLKNVKYCQFNWI